MSDRGRDFATPVEANASLVVGQVETVAPDKITVAMSLDAPQATALNPGQPIRFPRLGGYLLMPNEGGAVVGMITWLGIERSTYPKRPGLKDFGLVDLPFPARKMILTPLGTLASGGGTSDSKLERGVVAFPSVGDPVLLPTLSQLSVLVEAREGDRRVAIGRALITRRAQVFVDPNKLFGRHLAVLGNTGSGKSCSVAGVIRWSIEAAVEEILRLEGAEHDAKDDLPVPNARFVVLDPNGEYRQSFGDLPGGVRVFQVPPVQPPAEDLRIPAWLWNSAEWAAFSQASARAQRPVLNHGLRILRAATELSEEQEHKLAIVIGGHRDFFRAALGDVERYTAWPGKSDCGERLRVLLETLPVYGESLPNLADDLDSLTSDVKELYDRRWLGKGFSAFNSVEIEEIVECLDRIADLLPEVSTLAAGNEDAPLPFDPHRLAPQLELMTTSSPGFQEAARYIGNLTMRVRAMLSDERIAPVIAPDENVEFASWLAGIIGADQAANGNVSIIDLSLVPSDVIDIAVAVVARIVFEALQRYRRLNGETLPTVLVLEEAHTFVPQHRHFDPDQPTPAHMCIETFERIAREGRKFGLGLVLSSQRPSELSETVLAQCNTFLLHRLVNDRDQDLVGRLVPDNLAGLLDELPALPAQNAILLGWATPIPVLMQVRHLPVEHRPHSEDPNYWKVWTHKDARVDWPRVVQHWRGKATGADLASAAESVGDDAADSVHGGTKDQRHPMVWTEENRPAGSGKPGAPETGTGLSTGDRVEHASFGAGTVVSVEPGGVVTIQFDEGGSNRKLVADLAPLTKIGAQRPGDGPAFAPNG